MKLFWALFILLVLSVGILFYVGQENKKLPADLAHTTESQNYVESVTAVSSSSLKGETPVEFRLRILSEPDGAEIFLDAQRAGVAPLEVTISEQSQKLKLSVEGYDDYERQVPAAKDAEGDLVWKIQLKKINSKKEQIEKAKFVFKKQNLKGWLLQLKALSLSEFKPELLKNYQNLSEVKTCKVRIKNEEWVRVLVGPYAQKKTALKVLESLKTEWPETFLTQNQICLGDHGASSQSLNKKSIVGKKNKK